MLFLIRLSLFAELIFELQEPKAKLEGIFERFYCRYGTLLNQEDDLKMSTNDGALAIN